jgi:protein-tyrosine phosphatase
VFIIHKPRILFVCGKNQWRSPTAERVYRNDPRVEVRSVGVSEKSRRRISNADLSWADLIMVMERRYKSRITETFRGHDRLPPIVSLEIPDEYEYMDEELIKLIHEGVEFRLKHEFKTEPNKERQKR